MTDDDSTNVIIQNIKISTNYLYQSCPKDETDRRQFQADVQALKFRPIDNVLGSGRSSSGFAKKPF